MKMHRGPKERHPHLKRGLPALAMLASPSALYAQSCALCYQSAAHSGAHFIQALKHGILILLFPPLCIGTGIAIMAYRKRNQHADFFFKQKTAYEILCPTAVNVSVDPPQTLNGFSASSTRVSVFPRSSRESSVRSEEHTSELQSRRDLVCRLLLEKKKTKNQNIYSTNDINYE